MVCTREAYLALAAAAGSPMPGGQCVPVQQRGGREHALPLALAVAVVVFGWKRACLYADAKGRVSLNTGGVSGGLKVCASVARCVPACRSMHRVGVSGLPLALSLAVRSLAGCTADRSAD